MPHAPLDIDATAAFISPTMIRMLLHEFTKREWLRPEWAQAHPIQRICIQNNYTTVEIHESQEVTPHLLREHGLTLGGIPVKIDPTMRDNVIEF